MAKPRKVLDWYGNPLPDDKIPRPQENLKGETGADGRKYLRPWSDDGKPGTRIPLTDCYLVIRDDQDKVVYDFGRTPPADANIQSGYVGFLFEEILKGYFGESYADKVKDSRVWKPTPSDAYWIETTEDGQKRVRWNVIWHDWLSPEDLKPATG